MITLTLTGTLYIDHLPGKITIKENKVIFWTYDNGKRSTFSAPLKPFEYARRKDNSGQEYEYLYCMTSEKEYNQYRGEMDYGSCSLQTWDRKEVFFGVVFLHRRYPRAEKELYRESEILVLDEKSQKVLSEYLNTFR